MIINCLKGMYQRKETSGPEISRTLAISSKLGTSLPGAVLSFLGLVNLLSVAVSVFLAAAFHLFATYAL
jgi:hypothetical protein